MAKIYDYRSDIERVRDTAEAYGIGLLEAKRIVLRDDLRHEISRAESVEDIKRILLDVFPAIREVPAPGVDKPDGEPDASQHG